LSFINGFVRFDTANVSNINGCAETMGFGVIISPVNHSNLDIFANLGDKPVAELTGRVTDVSIRPVSGGGYSDVWTGKLNGTQEVNGILLVRSSLLMTGRLQSNVFETKKRRQKG
jgi:hypothetical protein